MSKDFKVDSRLWKKRSKDVIKILKIDEPKFVKEQAGILAQQLTKVTPPFDGFPLLEKIGYAQKGDYAKGRESTLSGFFSSVKRVGAEGKWKDKKMRSAIRRGDTHYITERLRYMKGSNKFNLEAHPYSDHLRNKKRNKRGRVNRNTQPFVGIKTKDVNAGLKRALGNVGISKAALAKIAVRLGRKKPPDWISRHFSKLNVSISVQKNPSVIRFRTSGPGLDVAKRNAKKVERFRMIAMEQRLESLVRATAKKAGFKVKR